MCPQEHGRKEGVTGDSYHLLLSLSLPQWENEQQQGNRNTRRRFLGSREAGCSVGRDSQTRIWGVCKRVIMNKKHAVQQIPCNLLRLSDKDQPAYPTDVTDSKEKQ